MVRFKDRIINNEKARELFLEVKNVKLNRKEKPTQELLAKFVSQLIAMDKIESNYTPEMPLKNWNVLENYIEKNLFETIRLEDLAKCVFLNKYTFSRYFKKSTGMTPINYVLMKRIFHSLENIGADTPLKNLAYSYGFTDASHYSKFFKRFIGISPLRYRSSFAP